jgi:hypothetical protein
MKVLKQLLSFFLTALAVSVSGQSTKPELSPVRDAGKAMRIAFIVLRGPQRAYPLGRLPIC